MTNANNQPGTPDSSAAFVAANIAGSGTGPSGKSEPVNTKSWDEREAEIKKDDITTFTNYLITLGALTEILTGLKKLYQADPRIDELQGEVATLFDGRYREDKGFRPQVRANERIRCVGVRRLDGDVGGGVDVGRVVDGVPGGLELWTALIGEVRVHDAVVVDHRKAVDIRLRGNVAG